MDLEGGGTLVRKTHDYHQILPQISHEPLFERKKNVAGEASLGYPGSTLLLRGASPPLPSPHQAPHVETLTWVNPSWRETIEQVSATWEVKVP